MVLRNSIINCTPLKNISFLSHPNYSASSIIRTGLTQFKDGPFGYAENSDNRRWPFDPFPYPLNGSFLAWLKRKPRQKRKLLFVSDTNDNHHIICQQNSKVNKKKTSSVLNILRKKDGIEPCLRPSLVFRQSRFG